MNRLIFALKSLPQPRLFVFLWILISLVAISTETTAQCKPQVWCFTQNEEIYYNIVYNWGFIWVDAGRVEFKARKELLDGRFVYHFSGAGTSLKKFDWFFKVRDYYESY